MRNHQPRKTRRSLVPKGAEGGSPVKKRGDNSIVEDAAGSCSTDSDSCDEVKALVFES